MKGLTEKGFQEKRAHLTIGTRAAYLDGKLGTPRVPTGMHLDHDTDACPYGTLCVACTELVTAAVNQARRHSRTRKV